MEAKKVSVIVPVYNAEAWLSRCLDALVNQTLYEMMEIIIIDDGSTDHSSEIISMFAQKYNHIMSLRVPNGGVSRARNRGIALASGEFIGFVDADDWVEPDFYERLYTQASACEADIVSMGFTVDTAERGSTMLCQTAEAPQCLDQNEALQKYLTEELDIHVCTKLFRRQNCLQQGFDETLVIAEDRLFVFYQITQAKRFCLLPQCGYHYFQNQASAMHQAFSAKKLGSITVSQQILRYVKEHSPALIPLAQCLDISAKCRVLTNLSTANNRGEFSQQYASLVQSVRAFPLRSARRYMNRKHFLVFLLTRFSPVLTGFLKENPWLRYRK